MLRKRICIQPHCQSLNRFAESSPTTLIYSPRNLNSSVGPLPRASVTASSSPKFRCFGKDRLEYNGGPLLIRIQRRDVEDLPDFSCRRWRRESQNPSTTTGVRRLPVPRVRGRVRGIRTCDHPGG